jgi:hypothetical protein
MQSSKTPCHVESQNIHIPRNNNIITFKNVIIEIYLSPGITYLTLSLLMSYIYIYTCVCLCVCVELLAKPEIQRIYIYKDESCYLRFYFLNRTFR